MRVEERKAELRRTERRLGRRIASGEDLFGKSLSIQGNFLSAFPPARGSRIALYKAVEGEVDTDLVRDRLLAAGAFPYYPRVMDERRLSFYPYRPGGGWVRGKYGILEPRAERGTEGRDSGFHLVVVPGMAFDRNGRRLGRGSGYYDRFLAGLEGTAVVVGFAFSRQMVTEVPVNERDVPMDVVITEDDIVRASAKQWSPT